MAKFVSRPKACEFSLEDLQSVEGRSGLLCVSQSTWMLAYSLVSFYGYWRSRYYKTLPDGSQVTLDDTEWEEITDYVDLAIEELSMTGCSDMVDAINNLTTTLSAKLVAMQQYCKTQVITGVTQNQDIAHNGTVSVGQPEDQFPTQDAYLDAKCNIANAIYDTILGFVTDISNDDMSALTSGATGGLVGIISFKLSDAGPLGWAISKVSTLVTKIAFSFLSFIFNWDDIAAALDETHEDIVNGLYNSSNTSTARSNFLSALAGSATTLTDVEDSLVADLLSNDMLNQLFDPRSDTATYQSPNPVNCTPGVDACTLLKMAIFSPYNAWLRGDVVASTGSYYADEYGHHFNGPGSFTVEFSHIGETFDIEYTWRCTGELYLFSQTNGYIRFFVLGDAIGSGANKAIHVFEYPQQVGVWGSGSNLMTWIWDDDGFGEMPDTGQITFFYEESAHITIRNVEIRIVLDPDCPDPEA